MAGRSFVVLDVGRTSTRVCVVDERGTLLASRRRDSAVAPGPPYPHLDVESTWRFLLTALRELAAEHAPEAIVPVAHGAAVALVAGGELALPVLDYLAELPPLELDSGTYAETLSPRLPAGLNLASQLAWLQARFPADFARAEHFLLLPQYWAWRLGGRPASERSSLGCHTHLWAPREGRFSALARARGWDRRFPPLARAWEAIGTLAPAVAAATGLPESCRIHAGVHDSNASYLAHRAFREEPFAVVSTGTWVVCLAHGAPLERLCEERDMLANVDVLGAPVACMRFAGGREHAALAGEPAAPATMREVERALAEGLLALPSFCAEGGPFRARAGRVLPRPPESPSARAALAALYLALMIDLCLDELGARGDAILEGPMAGNVALAATLAALRAPAAVLRSDDATGTLRGAALLARWEEPRVPPALARVEPARLAGLEAHRARWRAALEAEPAA